MGANGRATDLAGGRPYTRLEETSGTLTAQGCLGNYEFKIERRSERLGLNGLWKLPEHDGVGAIVVWVCSYLLLLSCRGACPL